MVSSSKRKTFTIQSESGQVEKIRAEIAPLLAGAGFSEKDCQSMLVALGEAVTNSMRHSYGCEAGHPIEITFEEAPGKITLRIRDYGKKIDPAKAKAREKPELPPTKPGGLGLYFMQTIMDGMEYNTAHSEGNELILTKNRK